jgi:hypothetical protein
MGGDQQRQHPSRRREPTGNRCDHVPQLVLLTGKTRVRKESLDEDRFLTFFPSRGRDRGNLGSEIQNGGSYRISGSPYRFDPLW